MKKHFITFQAIICFFSICSAQIYDLPECIEIALERKRTLVSADLDVQSATKQVIGSYSGVLPSVSFSTNGGRTKYPNQESIVPDLVNLEIDTINSGESSYMSAGLSINKSIYNGGQSVNAIKQANINLDISKLRERNTKILVIQNVTRSYYSLLKSQELLDVAKENLILSQKQIDLVQKQFELGSVSKTDFLKAKAHARRRK